MKISRGLSLVSCVKGSISISTEDSKYEISDDGVWDPFDMGSMRFMIEKVVMGNLEYEEASIHE